MRCDQILASLSNPFHSISTIFHKREILKKYRCLSIFIALMQFLLLSSAYSYAQVARDSELFLAIKAQDSMFFEKSFNLCDLDYLEGAVHKDLAFFHDQGGIQNREQFLEAVRKNICGNMQQKPIRKVDTSSLEVYPLYSNGELYGVIQHGIHYFYIRESGKQDQPTGIAKFTHVYLKDNNKWLLKESLSYDHHPYNGKP